MKKVKYRNTSVVRVDMETLTYLDDDGQECVIVFGECCANMRKFLGATVSDSEKCVGFRNSSASPAYVEILTEPPTRFEFPKPMASSVSRGSKFVPRMPALGYGEFLKLLADAGTETIDMG